MTLSWITLQWSLYRVHGKNKTKRSAAGYSQCYAIISWKSHVFRRLRNDRSDGASLTAGGRLFQAATGNARLPSVERLVGLTTGDGESVDRRWRRQTATQCGKNWDKEIILRELLKHQVGRDPFCCSCFNCSSWSVYGYVFVFIYVYNWYTFARFLLSFKWVLVLTVSSFSSDFIIIF